MVKLVRNICVFGLCLLIGGCGYGLKTARTRAMLPTIPFDSYIVADEMAYSSGESIERFDIVINRIPVDDLLEKLGMDENSKYVFRVIGLSGEQIEIKDGKVFINGSRITEPFKTILWKGDFGPFTIPAEEFFLLGDNRSGSYDSRHWRTVTIKRKNILGKVVKIF